MTRDEYKAAQKEAEEMINASGIRLSQKEADSIEVVDFGLNNLRTEGAQILTLVQTERISVKVLALFPDQTEPEHWHPRVADDPGKEETIRVVKGALYLYTPGIETIVSAKTPDNKSKVYTCTNEQVMYSNDQVTLSPGTKHWFKAGSDGVVIYSYSTIARDILDKFTDPDVVRISKIMY